MTEKTRKHVLYAHRILVRIRLELGNRCAHCGAEDGEKGTLELDHISAGSRTWSLRSAGLIGGALKYRRDHQAGLLQLLCRSCHEEKSFGRGGQKAFAFAGKVGEA